MKVDKYLSHAAIKESTSVAHLLAVLEEPLEILVIFQLCEKLTGCLTILLMPVKTHHTLKIICLLCLTLIFITVENVLHCTFPQ